MNHKTCLSTDGSVHKRREETIQILVTTYEQQNSKNTGNRRYL